MIIYKLVWGLCVNCSTVSDAIRGLSFGMRVPVIDNVMCNGSEVTLEQCLTVEPGNVSQECTNSSMRAAGVRCYQG